MKNDLEENFFRVYKGFINNPIRNREKEDDSDLIGKVIHDFYFYGSHHMPEKYYDFLMSEIDKLGKPIVSAALIKRIEQAENEADEYYDSDPRKELYDGREDEEDEDDEDDEDDNYLGFIDVLDGIGKELSQLRAKYADMEEEVKRLTKEVKILRSKDEPQEFYCKVRLDREPAGWGLWYKCSDRTVCAGDRVIVPYGKDNERLAGEVVETGYFKSCDFDFSMDKMKNIIEIKK